ncbi:MAG: type II toxin-antitoxin system VapC family toxin [Verrucomicrobiota bacterium]|nr:type II toxin-antitoxin system VapC family toxin [Verrucomicrobiota bacterium]
MNVVDSSGWIEFLGGGANAEFFLKAVSDVPRLVVPTICVFEVCRWMRRELGERRALEAMALMQQGSIIELDATLAMSAARLSLELKLPMADSIVYAIAHANKATLWTQDDDFEGLEDVKYIAKKKGAK